MSIYKVSSSHRSAYASGPFRDSAVIIPTKRMGRNSGVLLTPHRRRKRGRRSKESKEESVEEVTLRQGWIAFAPFSQ